MRTLILALIPGLLLAACSDDSTASAGTSASTTDSTGTATTGDPTGSPTSAPTGDPSTSTSPTSGISDSDGQTTNPTGEPVTSSTSSTTEPATTEPATTEPATTEPGTTTTTGDTTTGDTTDTSTGDTTDTTDTGGGLCGADGPEVDATLVHIGEDPGCGPLEFTGTNYELGAGPTYMLDGCPCGAQCIKPDPWTFSVTAPADWLPGPLPVCPRIVIERQNSKQGCQLVGLAIWDTEEPDAAPAVYHAGHALGPIVAATGELATEQTVVEECDCDFCCNTPARYDLTFATLGGEATIAEGDFGMIGGPELGYAIANFQSHLSGLCDDPAAIDWVARRFGTP